MATRRRRGRSKHGEYDESNSEEKEKDESDTDNGRMEDYAVKSKKLDKVRVDEENKLMIKVPNKVIKGLDKRNGKRLAPEDENYDQEVTMDPLDGEKKRRKNNLTHEAANANVNKSTDKEKDERGKGMRRDSLGSGYTSSPLREGDRGRVTEERGDHDYTDPQSDSENHERQGGLPGELKIKIRVESQDNDKEKEKNGRPKKLLQRRFSIASSEREAKTLPSYSPLASPSLSPLQSPSYSPSLSPSPSPLPSSPLSVPSSPSIDSSSLRSEPVLLLDYPTITQKTHPLFSRVSTARSTQGIPSP